MQLAPQPRVHTAHGRPHYEARVVHAEPFGEQTILRLHHVDIAITWKFGAHTITRLARFTVPDRIRQHDEELARIKRLIFPEKLSRKLRADKLRAAARRPMHDEHRVARPPLRIFLRFPQRPIMEAQLRYNLG